MARPAATAAQAAGPLLDYTFNLRQGDAETIGGPGVGRLPGINRGHRRWLVRRRQGSRSAGSLGITESGLQSLEARRSGWRRPTRGFLRELGAHPDQSSRDFLVRE